MITYTGWSDVREALDDYQGKGLIISWQHVPGLGLVVISGDMEEADLKTLREASLYLAALTGAECAYRDGKAKTGTEGGSDDG